MFRIYTEDTNREGIVRVINSHGLDATLIPAIGLWHGKQENSLIIELAELVSGFMAKVLASEIGELNKQESVLVVELPEVQPFFV